MTYRTSPPTRMLASLVDCYWEHDGTAASAPASQRVVPDGCIDIVFVRGTRDEVRLVGPMTVAREFDTSTERSITGVRFSPGGARALLGLHARALQDVVTPLRDAMKLDGWLESELGKAHDAPRRFAALERFLLDRRDSHLASIDAALASVISELRHAASGTSIPKLCHKHGIGERRLRRMFEDWVGLSPKYFLRVMRLQRALEQARHAPVRWLGVALDSGFYDQPHMNRDFRELVGLSPAQYFASRR